MCDIFFGSFVPVGFLGSTYIDIANSDSAGHFVGIDGVIGGSWVVNLSVFASGRSQAQASIKFEVGKLVVLEFRARVLLPYKSFLSD